MFHIVFSRLVSYLTQKGVWGLGGVGDWEGVSDWGEGGSNLNINSFEKELEQKFKISKFRIFYSKRAPTCS